MNPSLPAIVETPEFIAAVYQKAASLELDGESFQKSAELAVAGVLEYFRKEAKMSDAQISGAMTGLALIGLAEAGEIDRDEIQKRAALNDYNPLARGLSSAVGAIGSAGKAVIGTGQAIGEKGLAGAAEDIAARAINSPTGQGLIQKADSAIQGAMAPGDGSPRSPLQEAIFNAGKKTESGLQMGVGHAFRSTELGKGITDSLANGKDGEGIGGIVTKGLNWMTDPNNLKTMAPYVIGGLGAFGIGKAMGAGNMGSLALGAAGALGAPHLMSAFDQWNKSRQTTGDASAGAAAPAAPTTPSHIAPVTPAPVAPAKSNQDIALTEAQRADEKARLGGGGY